MSPHSLTWIIAAIAAAGVILRPFDWPEAIWAMAGAALLVALQLLSPRDALTGMGKGVDVYLFLIGMMLLAEVAPPGRTLRLAGGGRRQAREGLRQPIVCSRLRRGRDRDHILVE